MMEDDEVVIFRSIHVCVSMLRASLTVLALPQRAIPKCAWWLLREFGNFSTDEEVLSISRRKGFGMILQDDDGLSVILDKIKVSALQYLIAPEYYTRSPFNWKAFLINMRGSAIEVPGAVYCLANALSSEGLSILHISTFEFEVFLIQEPDLERAIKILKEFENPQRITMILENRYSESVDKISKSGKESQDLTIDSVRNEEADQEDVKIFQNDIEHRGSMDNEETSNENLDLSWITPQVKSTISLANQLSETQKISSKTKLDEGFTLCVLPSPMIMAKCARLEMKSLTDVMVSLSLP